MSFTAEEVLNALMWGFLVLVFALGYVAGRLR